ncbi:MAG TPA: hypothetical protein VN932_06255, partial [Rhizomicrobium sp.]|nr:hypothetical protein [Rhizomicrobium sp.]
MSWIKDLLGLNVSRPLPIDDLQFDRASLLNSTSRATPIPDVQAANASNSTPRAIDARAAVRADLSTITGSLHDGASAHILPATSHDG